MHDSVSHWLGSPEVADPGSYAADRDRPRSPRVAWLSQAYITWQWTPLETSTSPPLQSIVAHTPPLLDSAPWTLSSSPLADKPVCVRGVPIWPCFNRSVPMSSLFQLMPDSMSSHPSSSLCSSIRKISCPSVSKCWCLEQYPSSGVARPSAT